MNRKHHVLVLCGLVGFGALVEAVVVSRAVVPSLDAVRFAREAQRGVGQGPMAAIRGGGEQPLFPLWVAAVERGLAWCGGESASIWATSVELSAAIPLVLTVVPLYLLLVRLFDARIAVIGAIFFCVLPEVRRLGADGISDSTHLLFFTAALWAAVEGLSWRSGSGESKDSGPPLHYGPGTRRQAMWLGLAGLFTGLALLTRAEAIILPAALVLSFVVFCAARRSRAVLRAAVCGVAVYAVGMAIVLGPYFVAAGVDTPRAAVARVLGRGAPAAANGLTMTGEEFLWQTSDGRALDFAVKEGSIRRCGYAAALGQYAEELAGVFGYGLGALALWALWRHRRDVARPADRLMQIFFAVYSVAVVIFVAHEGYLGARHLLPLLVAGLGMAAVGTWEASVLLSQRLWSRKGDSPLLPARPFGCFAQKGTVPFSRPWAIVALVVAVYLVSTGCPLRANRLGHRQAGAWLARQTHDGLAVLDTRGWTALYSARPTYPYAEAKKALRDPRLGYVVVERAELRRASDRSWTLRWLLASAGRPVARFNGPGGDAKNAVVVYRWDAERFRAALEPGTATPRVRSASRKERISR